MANVMKSADGKMTATDADDRWVPEMRTGRLEALTDGTFAIAMTILVLELSVPHLLPEAVPGGHPTSFFDMWDEFYIYVLGFLALGVYWVLHSYMFCFIKRSDGVLLWMNILFLVLAALVPFSTKVLEVNEALIAGPDSQWTSAGLFFTAMTVGAILLLLIMWRYASRDYRLIDQGIDHRTVSVFNRVILIGAGIMCLGTVLSYFYPPAGLLGFVALAYMIVMTARGRHRSVAG